MEKHCEICDIKLNVHEYEKHVIGKKHLKKAVYKHVEKRMLEHSIYVSNIPRSVSKKTLMKFFQQYGTIAKYNIYGGSAIIEYTDREPVDYLLKNPVWMYKHKLNIHKRKLPSVKGSKKGDGNNSEDQDLISIDVIRDKFKNETTFDSQFTAFLDAIKLNDAEVAIRYDSICPYLDKIFACIFPNCRTYKFGSTLTGLGFKGCDLDIYMDIDTSIHTQGYEKQPWEVNKQLPNTLTMPQIFTRVKSIMYKMRSVFADITPILNANTPIIKFHYIPTNVSCDISFKNGFGVYNSMLIKHCLSYDVRIKPLIMLIKYWAKQRKLTLCGKISNYALILMILFYLQQPELGILPPLMEFQKTCTPIFIDGWQVNSNGNATLPKSRNTNTIPELLQGFFEFYMNYDFEENIICPLDGVIHSKQEFNKTEGLPNYLLAFKEMVMSEKVNVYIQDSIELNHNILRSKSKKLIDSFQAFCEMGADICMSSRTENYDNLLTYLLYPIQQAQHNFQSVLTINIERYLNVGLPDNFEKRQDITDKNQYKKDALFFTAFNIVKDIFMKVFKLEVEILSADNNTKQQKIEVLSDVHTREHKELLLHCKGNNSVWFSRRRNITILDPSMSNLDREAAISNKIEEENSQKEDSTNKQLHFVCKFQKKENPLRIQLTLNNRNTKRKVFKDFQHIATSKLPEITIRSLMHMLQFKKHY